MLKLLCKNQIEVILQKSCRSYFAKIVNPFHQRLPTTWNVVTEMNFDCCLDRLVTRLHATVGRAPASLFENATELTPDCGLENRRWGESRRDRRNLTAGIIRQNIKEISRKLVTSFSKANERRAVTGQCSTGHNQSRRPALGRFMCLFSKH